MHAPVDVNIEDADELVAARGVCVPADTGEQLVHVDVVPDDGVEDPFCWAGGGVPRSEPVM